MSKKELLILYKTEINTSFSIENLKNFNEKIQWMKIYDNNFLKIQLVDSYLVWE